MPTATQSPSPVPIFTPQHRWHVLVVETGAERRVADDADKLGLQVYYPKSKRAEWDRQRRFAHEIDRPAFGRYLFASVSIRRPEFSAYLAIDGAVEFLSNDGAPEPVADDIIADVKRDEARGAYDQVVKHAGSRALTPRWLKVGNVVAITGGVWATLGVRHATVLEVRRDGIAKVEFNLFGRLTPADVPIAFLSKLR